jgi:hypothetical protein
MKRDGMRLAAARVEERSNEMELKERNFIDKKYIGNFLINYFDLSENSEVRVQLLGTLAGLLDFNEEEKKRVGLRGKGGVGVKNGGGDEKGDDGKIQGGNTANGKTTASIGDKFMSFLMGDSED